MSNKKEVKSKDTLRFTWTSKKAADEEQNKSAITNRATRENNIIDWNGVTVIGHESIHGTRCIKEPIAIRKHKGRAMNRDTGSYFLLSTYDKLLLHDSARFHQNDTLQRSVDTFLKMISADVKTST